MTMINACSKAMQYPWLNLEIGVVKRLYVYYLGFILLSDIPGFKLVKS